jgi:hypothetical protein
MKKINWAGLHWVIFHGIAWKRDIKDAIYSLYRKTPIFKAKDKAKFYRDMAKFNNLTDAERTPDVKCEIISAYIQTDFGKENLAKIMAAPIRLNLNYYNK